MRAQALFFACLWLGLASAYYVPGTYPEEFQKGDLLQGEALEGSACVEA